MPSLLAVASAGAVGAERHADTQPVWPVSGSPIGWPVAGSHSRTVPSAAGGGEPGAVGAERHRGHGAGVAGERVADRPAGGRVPQPHRLVARRAVASAGAVAG